MTLQSASVLLTVLGTAASAHAKDVSDRVTVV